MPKKSTKTTTNTTAPSKKRVVRKKGDMPIDDEMKQQESPKMEDKKLAKRKRSPKSDKTPAKRQKITDNIDQEVKIKATKVKPCSKNQNVQKVSSNAGDSKTIVKSKKTGESGRAKKKAIEQAKVPKIVAAKPRAKVCKPRSRVRASNSPYHNILDQLPQEIRNKIDLSKENINDICGSITLPKDYKPEYVIRWIRKVSQNELKIIHDEILSSRLNFEKLKRSQSYYDESIDARVVSMQSHRSEVSSKLDSEQCTAIKSRDTPMKIINYNLTLAEDNSACSKTSANTKNSPNLVRIPLNFGKLPNVAPKHKVSEVPFYLRQEPKLVSVDPGKSFIVKFEAVKDTPCGECAEIKVKRPIFAERNCQDIVVESLENPPHKLLKSDTLQQNEKLHPNFPFKHRLDNDQLINMFSSVGGKNDLDSINFNWGPNCESQDLNAADNFCKNEPHISKFCNVPQSNLSQIMDSVEGCGDYYFQKQILAGDIHLCNNMTPAFSMTEEFAEPIRPNGLEINDLQPSNLHEQNNLAVFPRERDCDIMLTEDFKSPIDVHNQ